MEENGIKYLNRLLNVVNMNRRKIVIYTVFFMLGISIGCRGNSLNVLIFTTVAFFCTLYSDVEKKKKILMVLLIFMIPAGAFLYWFNEYLLYDKTMEQYAGKPCTVAGTVLNIKQKKNQNFEMLCLVDGRKIICTYRGKINNYCSIIGRRIIFTLRLKSTSDNIFFRSQKAGYCSFLSGFLLEDFSDSFILSIRRKVLLVRNHFLRPLTEYYDPGGKLLPGILFGDTSYMNNELRSVFSENGTAHILAVSGLHVGILYGAYRILEKKFRNHLIRVLFIVMMSIYCTASQWSVSVMRAFIMILVLMGGELFCRRYDMLTAVFLSSCIILIQNPYELFSVSFHMSFLAVISIAFLNPLFQEYIGSYPAVVISVQAGLAPYMLYIFDNYSFKGIVCNVPTIFLSSFIVPAGVLSFFFYMISGIRIPGMDLILSGVTDILFRINRFLVDLKFLDFNGKVESFSILAMYYTILFYASSEFFTIHRVRKKWGIMILTFCAFFTIIYIIGSAAFSFQT